MEQNLQEINAEGKRQLKRSYLEYSQEILRLIADNPEIMDELLARLNIDINEFYDNVSGTRVANITFYDEAVQVAKELSDSKSYKR